MVVLILEKVPVSLRGELSRWMLEPKSGVFVGKVSAMVRDKLWEKTVKSVKSGSAILDYQTNNPQGYILRSHGEASRQVVDVEGLQLIKIPLKSN